MPHIGTTLETEDFVALGVFRAQSGVPQRDFIREAVRAALHDQGFQRRVCRQFIARREEQARLKADRKASGE